MKFYVPVVKLQVQIIKSKKPFRLIIPIGSDCHPAFFLKALGAKKYHLPFDSINMLPSEGLNYVNENFSNDFLRFDSNLFNSGFQRYKSSYFINAEFFHETYSLMKPKGRRLFRNRIAKLLHVKNSVPCSYLYCLPASALGSVDHMNTFVDSVQKFRTILKTTDFLHIYIRYEENEQENENECSRLLDHLNEIENVQLAKFVLKRKKFGVWGDRSRYLSLFEQLKLGSKPTTILKVGRLTRKRQALLLKGDCIGNLKKILVQVEDRRFYTHFGLDIIGIGRAVFQNLKAGRIVQGGSTLTQQLARNLANDNRISFRRKWREVIITLKIEARFSKEKIFDLYLRRVYFGYKINGFFAASSKYFNKTLSDLSLSECLVLVTILRSPMYYLGNPQKLKSRYLLLNEILMERKCLTWSQYDCNRKSAIVYDANTIMLTVVTDEDHSGQVSRM